MNIENDLSFLLDVKIDPEDLAYDHAMDISASVYARMAELGITSKELAERMGVGKARVSRLLSGEQSMTLKTLARLEDSLDMDMSYGFRAPRAIDVDRSTCKIIDFNALTPDRRHFTTTNWEAREC